ncbi:MAG: VanZ family protein [Nitrospirales bacterium]
MEEIRYTGITVLLVRRLSISAIALPRKLLAYWLPLLSYAGLIFYFSSLPLKELEPLLPPVLEELGDKVAHGMEYAVLGVLWYRALRLAGGPWAAARALPLAIIFSAGYGLSDEFHQAFVPTREMDWFDVAADIVGASLGAWLWHAKVASGWPHQA